MPIASNIDTQSEEFRANAARMRALTEELVRASDAVVIVTDHSAFDWNWIVAHARLVIDTRNATRDIQQGRERIVGA